jgi:hypothetical protein
MGFAIGDLELTLEKIFGANAQFRLKKVSPWQEYDEDVGEDSNEKEKEKKTRPLLGYKYHVVYQDFGIKFVVKVEEPVAAIENQDIQKSASHVMVSFPNAAVGFYGKGLWDCDMSVTAEKVIIKNKPAQ